MKVLFAFFLGMLFVSCMSKGECQEVKTTTYVNNYGQPVATIQQIGNTVYVSNQYGQLVGSATTLPLPQSAVASVANVLPILPTLPMIGAPR